ncbi:MAG: MFS transporter [Cyanobacteria bacterium P01_E01_bin.42]
MPQPNTPASTILKSPFNQWLILFAVSLGTFLFSLDVHIVNVALPTIVKAYQSDFATGEWIQISYALMLAILVLAVGRLGDMWSKKRLYLLGVIVFALGSLGCGLTPSIQGLIIARVFQGLGAVFIAVLAPAIVTETFPNTQRGLGLGIIVSVGWAGVSLGPTIGGFILQNWEWRLIFFINIPICLLSFILVFLLVDREKSSDERESFDFTGAFLLAATLLCFLLGVARIQEANGGGSLTLLLLLISGLGLAGFLRSQQQTSQPLLDLGLFQSRDLTLNLLMTLIGYMFTNSIMFLFPFFLELVKHFPEQQVGLMLAVMPALGVAVGPIAGYLADRIGERPISTIGFGMILISCLAISTFNEGLTVIGYLVRVVPFAIGYGIFQPPNQSAIFKIAPKQYLSVISGLLFFSRALGQVIGITFMSVLFSRLTASRVVGDDFTSLFSAPVEALVFGEQVSFRIFAGLLAVGFLIGLYLWRRSELAPNNT